MADFVFGVEDAKVAAWTSTGSYGTLYDVVGISQVRITEELTSAELEGDDKVVATHAKSRVVRGRARFGFRDMNVLNIMTGAVVNAAAGSYDQQTTFAGRNYPYFGFVAKVDEVNATGCRHLFVPKAKIMSNFEVGFEHGQFSTPEFEFEGVEDGVYGMWQIYDYTTLKAIVIPPV